MTRPAKPRKPHIARRRLMDGDEWALFIPLSCMWEWPRLHLMVWWWLVRLATAQLNPFKRPMEDRDE